MVYFDSMQLVVQNLITNIQRYGGGKQLLILHGWGDNSRGWDAFAKALAPDYEVIVPDLPGFGGSEAPHATWGIDDYAAFVAALIAKADLKPFAVIGHSNGGAIAIRGIATGKLTPEKLVLLASAGIRGENKGRNAAWQAVAKAGKIAALPLPATVKQQLQHKLYKAAGSDLLVAEHLQETFKRVVSEDMRKDAARVRIPTLLVYGTNDTATPLRYGQLFADAIAESQFEVLPDTGHFVQLDAKDAVLQLTKEFLR